MFRFLNMFFVFTFLVSCHSQRTPKTKKIAVSNENIAVFLRQDNFEILNTATLVVVYDIKKSLLKGTTNEYSNKVVLRDTLEKVKAKKLLKLLKDDASYDWEYKALNNDFNPTQQILIKNNTNRIFLLVDEKLQQLGFVNLQGQKVIRLIKEDFENLIELL